MGRIFGAGWKPSEAMILVIFFAFLLTFLVFAGVAGGQGRYELPEQGQQPFLSNLTPEEQQGPAGAKTLNRSGSQAKNKKAPRAAGIKKSAAGGVPRPDSPGPASKPPGLAQAQGFPVGLLGSGQFGKAAHQSGGSGAISFLDGYLLRSLHDEGMARKKAKKEDKPKDDFPQRGKTVTKF